MIHERTNACGFDKQYIYHTAWAARILAETKPREHIDISSAITFCTIVSAFIPIKYFEYRPPELLLSGLDVSSANLQNLPFETGSVSSISCMHVAEHVGLGRYGDALDPDGDLKTMNELKRVLAADGHLLFVVPVGKRRLQFNAHRVYDFYEIEKYFSDLQLVQKSLISDNRQQEGLITNPSRKQVASASYGCGCYWFRKATPC